MSWRNGYTEVGDLETNGSVLHACGGNKDVAIAVLHLVNEALESCALKAQRQRCMDFLSALEEADGDREGKDRGSHRLLKAVTVILRLKGFNARDHMMPIKEIDLEGHPLLAFTQPIRASASVSGKAEPVLRSLELAVHLARSSSSVSAVRLADCELGPEGGDKCISEVARLVRRVGIGSQSRFLDEVDLRGNYFDGDSTRKIVEAAVKERSERPHEAPTTPLWLDLSCNRVRNARVLFENLVAWASWAHDKTGALCMADLEGCSRKACARGSMLHMPNFLNQSKPEPAAQVKTDVNTTTPRLELLKSVETDAPAQSTQARPPVPLRVQRPVVQQLPRQAWKTHSRAPPRWSPGRRSPLANDRRRRSSPQSRPKDSREPSATKKASSPARFELKPGRGVSWSRDRGKRHGTCLRSRDDRRSRSKRRTSDRRRGRSDDRRDSARNGTGSSSVARHTRGGSTRQSRSRSRRRRKPVAVLRRNASPSRSRSASRSARLQSCAGSSRAGSQDNSCVRSDESDSSAGRQTPGFEGAGSDRCDSGEASQSHSPVVASDNARSDGCDGDAGSQGSAGSGCGSASEECGGKRDDEECADPGTRGSPEANEEYSYSYSYSEVGGSRSPARDEADGGNQLDVRLAKLFDNLKSSA
eukprot:TRINITY_DN43095_c0_g1_i1.p1 TRINITY_DN43095_c0_g1~~TRINITY_DN43095_c0_g1_i1.p1  ORF type:complete len:645 (+),score=84.02 TRINITY_DN43095_c0_g1_i1:167-2101(+)